MKRTAMKKTELIAANLEFQQQAELDRANLHNQLNEPPRQAGETLFQYKTRLKNKQIVHGLSPDDIIIFP